MKQIFLITAMILINLVAQENSYAQTLYNGVGHTSSFYQVEWHNAGLITAPPASADTIFPVNLNVRVTVDEKVRTTL